MKGYFSMSADELGRLEVIQKVAEKRLKQAQAGAILGISYGKLSDY